MWLAGLSLAGIQKSSSNGGLGLLEMGEERSESDLSDNKYSRLREVKHLCQGHTVTHHPSRKGSTRTAERDCT